MALSGKKIVLATSDSESSEYLGSQWRQMLLATLPARYARHLGTDWSIKNEVRPDGQAKYVPHGLRIIESLLLDRFAPEDIVVCYPDQMDRFIGDPTRVVGIHAHNWVSPSPRTSIQPFTAAKLNPSMRRNSVD
jgi:hypothetical protein